MYKPWRTFWKYLRGNPTDNLALAAALDLKQNANTAATQTDVQALQTAIGQKAPSANPTLSGNVAMATATSVTVPTVAANDNSNNAASTAHVKAALASLVNGAPSQLDTLNEFAAALGNDANYAATTAGLIGQKAPIASPNFTGIPLVDTAAPGTTTRQAASTAFVVNEVAAQIVNAPATLSKLKSTEGAFARRVLSLAKSQPVRILMIGTSISEISGAPNQVIAEQLKATYGDAQLFHQRLGLLGGSWLNAYSGWEKQVYGGISYTRLRGKSSSTAFTQVVYGSKIELWYSKETVANGASSFVLNVDGTDYTIDCTGASQSYGNVFTVPGLSLGTHVVTFNPPTSGNVYVEHLLVSRGLPGIEIVRGTLGGSLLQDAVVLHGITAPQVAGIAIDTNVGIDALFNRSDVNMIIYSGSVNDAGSYNGTNYQAAFSRAVAQTKARNVPLVIQAEPAGHYAKPTDPNYANYNTIKSTFAAATAANPHVVVVDWDAVTRIPDLLTYAATYYPTVTAGADSGTTWTGDYIHGNALMQSAGTSMLASLFNTRMPPTANEIEVLDKLRASNYDAQYLTDATVYDKLIPSVRKQVGWAQAITTNNGITMCKAVPIYDGTGVKDTGVIYNAIIGAGTSDSDGQYINYATITNLAVQQSAPLASGEKWTVTVLFKGTLTVRPSAGQIYFGSSSIAGVLTGANAQFQVTSSVLQAITFEWLPAATGDTLAFQGSLYIGSCVTRTQGIAVKCTGGTNVKRKSILLPDAKLSTDPAYNPDFYMQGYKDDAGVRKILVGPCVKHDFALYAAAFAANGSSENAAVRESALALRGLYRLSDRTQGNFQQVAPNATLTEVQGSIYTGGTGYNTTANPYVYTFTAFNMSAAGLYVTLLLPLYGVGVGWQIQAYNPSNGNIRYLNNDGTWTTASGTTIAVTGPNVNGLLAITFQPTIAQAADPNYILRADPTIRISKIGGGSLTAIGEATLCTGIHAMI